MSKIDSLLDPARRLVTAFFRSDVSLRREHGELRVVLQERGPRKPAEAEKKARRQSEELVQMRAELAALLNQKAGLRGTNRHLAFVEHALGRKGIKALHKLPLELLRMAHGQLEDLVTNWSPQGLANLRSKMAVAIIEREHLPAGTDAADSPQEEDLPDDLSTAAPSVHELTPGVDDSQVLAEAYAALGDAAPQLNLQVAAPAPMQLQLQGELGSRSARELDRLASRPAPLDETPEISIRVLQP